MVVQGVILRPGFVYGERSVKIPGPNGRERTVKVPLQRVGGPLSRITSTGLFRKIAGDALLCRGSVFGGPPIE